MKLDKQICRSVLTVGCQHLPPRGGVAQVLYIYDKYIFESFNKLTDTREGSRVVKLGQFGLACIMLFFRLLFDTKIKIVHVHTSSYNSFRRSKVFVRIAKMLRRRVVMHVHGGNFKEYYYSDPSGIKPVLDSCDCILALSDTWKSFFQSVTDGPEVVVVPNPVEPPRLMDVEADGKVHMLYLGLLTEAKGIYDLLDVVKEGLDDYNGRLILHVGGNGEVGQLQKVIEEAGLQDVVKYEGWLDGERKSRLMNRCCVYVLPSYHEGLPVSILEAMSYGEYIVSTKVGGIPEVVGKDVGVLINPGDRKALKDVLDSIVRSGESLPDRSLIRRHAQQYMPDRIALKLKEIYSEYL